MTNSDEEREYGINEVDDNDAFDDDSDVNTDEENDLGDLMRNKSVETIRFLREVLKENKKLQDRVNILEQELRESLNDQEISTKYKIPLKTHMLIETLDQEIQTDDNEEENEDHEQALIEAEKQWTFKKQEYERELNRVDVENEELKAKINELANTNKNLNENIAQLTKNLNQSLKENEELSKAKENVAAGGKELISLNKLNQELKEKLEKKRFDLLENKSIIDNLNLKITQMQDDMKSLEQNKLDEINMLNIKLTDHLKCEQLISEMEEVVSYKENHLSQANDELNRLNELINRLNEEIDELRSKIREQESNFNFKEFISIKRELNTLKQERNSMQANHNRYFESPRSLHKNSISTPGMTPLPPLKESLIKKKNQKPFK